MDIIKNIWNFVEKQLHNVLVLSILCNSSLQACRHEHLHQIGPDCQGAYSQSARHWLQLSGSHCPHIHTASIWQPLPTHSHSAHCGPESRVAVWVCKANKMTSNAHKINYVALFYLNSNLQLECTKIPRLRIDSILLPRKHRARAAPLQASPNLSDPIYLEKSRIRKTLTLSTNADSRTDTNLKRLRDLSLKKRRKKEVAWFI